MMPKEAIDQQDIQAEVSTHMGSQLQLEAHHSKYPLIELVRNHSSPFRGLGMCATTTKRRQLCLTLDSIDPNMDTISQELLAGLPTVTKLCGMQLAGNKLNASTKRSSMRIRNFA